MNLTLDKTRSFATIYGHSIAHYEQDGHMYDAVGDIIGHKPEYSLDAMVKRGERVPDELENAKAFLTRVLEGGPVMKSVVYKEAEANNQSWAEITKAVEAMGIVKLVGPGKGSPTMWKLPESVTP